MAERADRVLDGVRTRLREGVIALARGSRWRAALMRERNEAMRDVLHELAVSVQVQIDRLSDLTSGVNR